jgi:hypothetical protein
VPTHRCRTRHLCQPFPPTTNPPRRAAPADFQPRQRVAAAPGASAFALMPAVVRRRSYDFRLSVRRPSLFRPPRPLPASAFPPSRPRRRRRRHATIVLCPRPPGPSLLASHPPFPFTRSFGSGAASPLVRSYTRSHLVTPTPRPHVLLPGLSPSSSTSPRACRPRTPPLVVVAAVAPSSSAPVTLLRRRRASRVATNPCRLRRRPSSPSPPSPSLVPRRGRPLPRRHHLHHHRLPPACATPFAPGRRRRP